MLDRAVVKGLHRLAVALGFAVLGGEIFDGLVVEQGIDGAGDGLVVDLVHLAAKLGPPVGDDTSEGDVDNDHKKRGDDEPRAELDLEDDADDQDLDKGRRHVEQQDIEHGSEASTEQRRVGNKWYK